MVILETIAVIQTANAAISAVKELVGNGKDLMDCGKALGEYFSAKSKIQMKADRNGSGSDLEAFFALEKLKQQEKELKEIMIYSGRGGLWDDWLKFQADAKRQRDEALNAEKVKRAKKLKVIKEVIYGGVIALSILCAIGIIGFMFWCISQHSK